MLVNLSELYIAKGLGIPIRIPLPQNAWSEDPENALESSFELELMIEDVLQKFPKTQARIVRLAYGLTYGPCVRAMTPAEIGKHLGRSEVDVILLLNEALAILGKEPQLNVVFESIFDQ